MKKKVCVIVPVYKNELSRLESISLLQCFSILSKHDIIAIKPDYLSLSHPLELGSFSRVTSFEDLFFKDIQGYNQLMLSADFYRKFMDYEFMLIYQLDAFVFKDDLDYWCNKGFDYIGAPWLREHDYPDIVKKIKSKFQNVYHTRLNKQIKGIPTNIQFENQVGNGGFSLRRVQKFYDLALRYANLIDYYNTQSHHHFHEDAFWSVEINRHKRNLKIPSYKEALRFSIENAPKRAFKLNKSILPMGCHAWDKHLNFWKPILEPLYDI